MVVPGQTGWVSQRPIICAVVAQEGTYPIEDCPEVPPDPMLFSLIGHQKCSRILVIMQPRDTGHEARSSANTKAPDSL